MVAETKAYKTNILLFIAPNKSYQKETRQPGTLMFKAIIIFLCFYVLCLTFSEFENKGNLCTTLITVVICIHKSF